MKGDRHDHIEVSLLVRLSNPCANKPRNSRAASLPAMQPPSPGRVPQLPQAELPLSQRDAQLVLAREYGFPGWKDLLKEVKQRLGRGLEWAVSEARRIIHDNDVEGLRQLLAEYPALLSWTGPEPIDGVKRRRAARDGHRFLRRQLRPDQRAALHAQGMCRTPARCRRSRCAVGMRWPHPFARQEVDRSLPPQRPSSPNAQVLCRARRRRWRSRVSRYECGRSCRGERSVHVCVPFQHADRSGAAVGSVHRARRRTGQADRWRAGTFRIYPVLHREQARRPRPRSFRALAGFCQSNSVCARDARWRPDILCRRIAARIMAAVRRIREIPGRFDRGDGGDAERSRSFP